MALYRKYRPATFAEVVGQEHVTEPLSVALDSGRINHAYLFSGPRGCGKTSSARILARSLNCEQGPTSTPCGQCLSCTALAPGGSGNLDVIELDAASHGGVDDTRELRDRAFYAPAESRYRVFIIDEAHMVSPAGFNALLKIVEEPPEHLIFIFATTEPEKVLPTIRSRTHHYPFRLLAPAAMRSLMHRICADENVVVQEAVYPLVIRAGGGSPRDTLSVLDQLIAGAGEDGVQYARALALLGVTDVALIDEAVDALAALDGAALFGTVEKVMDAGHDPRRFAIDLLERLRDLILMRAVPDAADRGLIDAPADQLDRIREQSELIGPATLTRYAETVHAGLGEMRGATSPRLLLEVMCARMLLPSASDAESALLQRLERIERRLDVTRPAGEAERDSPPAPASPPRFRRPSEPGAPEPEPVAPEPVAPEPAAPEPAAPESAAPEPEPAAPEPEPAAPEPEPAAPEPIATHAGPDVAAVRAVWSEVRTKVRERSRTAEVMLSGATVRAVTGDAIVLGHDSAPLAKRLLEPRHAEAIRESLKDVLGVDWAVQCEVGSAPAAMQSAPAAMQSAPTAMPSAPRTPAQYSRPSRTAPPAVQGSTTQAAPTPSRADDIPLPDEPDDPEPPETDPAAAARSPGIETPPAETPRTEDPRAETEEDRQEMLADAARNPESIERRDPEEVALELLQSELGATRLTGRSDTAGS